MENIAQENAQKYLNNQLIAAVVLLGP